MTLLTVGKFRGLQQCASPHGTFTFLALDHRQNLRRANPGFQDDAALSRFKLDVLKELAPEATAVLLDPEFSAAQAVAGGILPKHVGLTVALEATGYGGEPTARQSRILPGWSVAKAKGMGADAVKLLVYYHPQSRTASEIETFVQNVAGECRRFDLALMLEPLSYSLEEDRRLTAEEKRFVVVETARRLTPLGVDLLKAEFPLSPEGGDEDGWLAACAEISAASRAPWILLSAAVDYETYIRQVIVACRAGASGVAVGRAAWQESVQMDGDARLAFLRTTGRARLSRLTALCLALAKPWTDFYSAAAPLDWFETYGTLDERP